MSRNLLTTGLFLVAVILTASLGVAQTETEYGNNLSVPAVFAEGYGLGGQLTNSDTGLRGVPISVGLPSLSDSTQCKDPVSGLPVTCYQQQSISEWQAEWANGDVNGESVIVNWSDNLINQRWTPKSPIRVEVVLYQHLGVEVGRALMQTYNMYFVSGSGATEMWATDGKTFMGDYRTVFSVNARLKIEKLFADGTVDSATTTACGFNGAIWEGMGQDGPGFYAAEVNVSGNLIYGFNWMINQCDATTDAKLGPWRLTFSLDPTATLPGGTTVEPNVTMADRDPLDLLGRYGVPTLAVDGKSTVLNVEIVRAKGGGGSSRRPN